MKKVLLTALGVSLIIACGNQKKEEDQVRDYMDAAVEDTIAASQAEEEEYPLLLGVHTREVIEQDTYDWFAQNYRYTPKEETITALKPALEGKSIILYMGTWCEDSHLQVPAFFKILDKTGFDREKVTLIMVSRDKKTPGGLEKGMDINYVPTIIVYKNEKELGRIVESPVETLEEDLLKIASGKEYKHTYQD